MRRVLFVVASIFVSALFLWLALRGIDNPNEIIESIRQADFFWVMVGFLSIIAGLWTRAVRWRGLLDFKIPLSKSFHATNITFLLNQLPLRAGEVARSLLATRSGVPVMTAATSIVVERLIDTVLVVIMLAFALSRLPSAPVEANRAATLFGIAAVVAFGFLLYFARYPQTAHKLLAQIENLLPFLKKLNLSRLLTNVLDGLKPLLNGRILIHAGVWTLISWAFSLLGLYAFELALDIQGVDLVLCAIMGLALAAFSIAIPVSVASIGPFEGAVLVAGTAVGMSEETAISLGFLFHGVTLAGYAVTGVISLLVTGVSLSDIFSVHSTTEASPDATSQPGVIN